MFIAAARVEGNVSIEAWQTEGCPHCGADLNVRGILLDDVIILRCQDCYTVFIVEPKEAVSGE